MRLLLFVSMVGLVSCAHEKAVRKTAPPPVAEAPAETRQPPAITDTDGDGVDDEIDPCPTQAGDGGQGCPQKWAYFFVRVINHNHLPVRAALAFQPVVRDVVAQEDGYAGTLKPGTYVLQVEAPGFNPTRTTFEVGHDEKALVEVILTPAQESTP